jgi:hypothetical protein
MKDSAPNPDLVGDLFFNSSAWHCKLTCSAPSPLDLKPLEPAAQACKCHPFGIAKSTQTALPAANRLPRGAGTPVKRSACAGCEHDTSIPKVSSWFMRRELVRRSALPILKRMRREVGRK